MQGFSPNSHIAALRPEVGSLRKSLKLSKEETVVKINKELELVYRVLIVDRDSMASGLLAHALVGDNRFEAVAIVAEDLLRAVSMSEIDLVVIAADLNTRWGTGFQLAEAVGRAHPETYIILLLNDSSQESVANAFRAGARGVFSRQQPVPEFIDCVEHVRKGFVWAGRQETVSLLELFRTMLPANLVADGDLPVLTARELEVIKHAAKGKTNKTIANDLRLSEHTVKNYLFRAFAKLGVSSRVELLFYLTNRRHGLPPAMVDIQEDEEVSSE